MQDLKVHWKLIRTHFKKSFRSSLHVSIASVDEMHVPTVTPIGSLFLNHDYSGYYFEKYPSKLPIHVKKNNCVSVLAVNSSKFFWLKSLFKGKFSAYPAMRLIGHLGEKRAATPTEVAKLKRRMSMTKRLKGNLYLWGDMNVVRPIQFEKVEFIKLGQMTSHLQ